MPGPFANSRDLSRVLLCAAVGAGSMLDGARTDANGQPVKSFEKDLIRTGTWHDPRTGDAFTVTSDDLNRWALEFARMKSNGIKVPVPNGHTDSADANRGWVEDMFVRGDTLFARIDLVGEDAIKLASTAEVSIYAPRELIGGKGEKYDNPIAHVALTPVPVISGQGGFVPIKASRGGVENVPVFRLSMESTMNPHLLSVAKAMGVDCSACKTDQDVHDAIMAARGKSSQDAVACARERDEAKAALALARTELEAAKKPASFSPIELKLTRKTREQDVGQLMADGNLTKSAADELKGVFAPGDDAGLALSMTPAADAIFEKTVAALRKNDPKVLAAQITANGRELARQVPGGEGTQTREQIDATVKAMYALAPIK